jgi:hypothetical protein
MIRRILFATLFVVAGHLLPATASASVVYQFLGITAALPPVPPFLPTGAPPHFEAFTLTTPTFLLVPTGPPEHVHSLLITVFDSCVSCSSPPAVFFTNFIPTSGGIQSAQIQFDDINNVGYAYSFLPGAFSTIGIHTTAQFDAVNGRSFGPFENSGILFVIAVPAPSSILLVILGVAMFLGFGCPRKEKLPSLGGWERLFGSDPRPGRFVPLQNMSATRLTRARVPR